MKEEPRVGGFETPESKRPVADYGSSSTFDLLSRDGRGQPASEVARARDEHARGDDAAARSRLESLLTRLSLSGPAEPAAKARHERIEACAWSLYGRVLLDLGDADQAQLAFRRAVELFDRVLASATDATGVERSDYGRALYRIAEYGRAVEQLQHAIDLDYHTFDTLKYLGLALCDERPADAVRYLEQALSLQNWDDEVNTALSRARGDSGDFVRLARGLWQHGRKEESATAFRAALAAADPGTDGEAEALIGLGLALVELGQPLEAKEYLERATGNETWAFNAHEFLAEALRQLGRTEDALEAIDKALAISEDGYSLGTKGQILKSLGRTEEAIGFLESAVEQAPGAQWIYQDLIPLLQQADRSADAIQHLQNLANYSPSLWVWTNLGELQRLAGDFESARSAIAEALALEPGSPMALGTMGQILRALGNKRDAVEYLKHAADLEPGWEWIYRDLIPLLRDAEVNQAAEAITWLQRLIAENPSVWAYNELGESLRLSERYDDALQALDKALELQPDSAYAMGTRAQVLRAKGDLEGARAGLEAALQMDNSLLWVKDELVRTLTQMDRHEDALVLLDRYLEEKKDWDVAWARKGSILRTLRRYEEAVAPLEEALRIDPVYRFALNELGETLRMLGRRTEALEYFDRALAVEADDSFALASKGAALADLGRLDEALPLLDRALELDSGNDFAVGVKASTLRQLDRSEEAIQILRRLLDSRPDSVSALGELGETLRATNREEEAVEVLDRALAINPDATFCLATRGYALRRIDRYEEALVDLEKCVGLDDNYAWARGALGHTRAEIGEMALAAADLNKAFQLDNGLVWCRGFEGYVKGVIGDAEGARIALADAHEREPEELLWTSTLADTLLALGRRDEATGLYHSIIDAAASRTADVDTTSRTAWAQRCLGDFEASARTYQKALSFAGTRIEYLRFDFALTLLCGGRDGLARREYERALEATALTHRWRARGLLIVALHDLEHAVIVHGEAADDQPGLHRSAYDEMHLMLQQALETYPSPAPREAVLA
jgi:tetratricopeptide (TPR) repeat protein